MFLSWLFGKKDKPVGKVVHFFDKISVAVIMLEGSLKVGDKVKITRGEDSFEDTVGSMQINHAEVTSAGRGQEVAIKVSRPTKSGALVHKV